MATTPTVNPTTLQSEVSALAHKFLYAHLGVIELLLGMMCAGGYFALRSYNAQLARAEAQEKIYVQDRNAWQAQMATDATERAAQATQIATLQAQIAHRDAQPLPKAVQAGLQPDATSATVANAVTLAYNDEPAFGQALPTPSGQVSLSVPQAQATILSKTSGDQAKADLKDEEAVVALQNSSITTLQTDLNGCKSTVSEANKTIDGYKKAAKRSRFRKFLAGAEKVALVAIGFEVGHKL